MNPSTFEKYQIASRLQDEARESMNRLEALADNGVRKAEKLLNLAWERYSRRTYIFNVAADRHWESL